MKGRIIIQKTLIFILISAFSFPLRSHDCGELTARWLECKTDQDCIEIQDVCAQSSASKQFEAQIKTYYGCLAKSVACERAHT